MILLLKKMMVVVRLITKKNKQTKKTSRSFEYKTKIVRRTPDENNT